MVALGQVILAAGLLTVGSPSPGARAAVPNSILLVPGAAGSAIVAAAPDQPADGIPPDPANSTANGALEPNPPGSGRRSRPPLWLILGILLAGGGIATALLAWRKSLAQHGGVAAAPAVDDPLATPATSAGGLAPGDSQIATQAEAADQALDSTSRLSRVDVVETLVEELTSADSAQRRHAIWELGQRGHSAAIQPLVNGLLEADSQEKSLIFAALAEISSRDLQPMHRALALGLQDPSPEVRKNAIRDLARVYDPVVQLSHLLAHAAQDPDLEVQQTAQWALGQLGRIAAAPYPSEPAPLESAYDGEGRRLPPGG